MPLLLVTSLQALVYTSIQPPPTPATQRFFPSVKKLLRIGYICNGMHLILCFDLPPSLHHHYRDVEDLQSLLCTLWWLLLDVSLAELRLGWLVRHWLQVHLWRNFQSRLTCGLVDNTGKIFPDCGLVLSIHWLNRVRRWKKRESSLSLLCRGMP